MLAINVSWLFLMVEANTDERESKDEVRNYEDIFEEF